jgi:hypothetical protein
MIMHDHILTMPRFCKKDIHTKEEIKSYSLYRIVSRGLKTFDLNSTPAKTFNYITSAICINYLRRLIDMDKEK